MQCFLWRDDTTQDGMPLPRRLRLQCTPGSACHSFTTDRFVVSEMSGTSAERAKYSGGVVFVEREQLAETCKFYLGRPELRKAIAARGRQLFERQREEEILRKPVEAILGRGDGGIPKAITM